MLRLENVSVDYGAVRALHSVNFDLPEGAAIAVLGANGAGKTTLLRAISRLVPTSSGSISYGGRSLLRESAAAVVSSGIAQVPEGRRVFSDISVADNLELGAYSVPASRADEKGRAQELVYRLFPRLLERQGQKAGSLSGGEQQMLAIGRALMSLPTLIMLDEPSLGLAPIVVESIYAALFELKSTGLSMLIVEQNVKFAERLADSAIVLANGNVSGLGSFADLIAAGSIEAAYLGKKRA